MTLRVLLAFAIALAIVSPLAVAGDGPPVMKVLVLGPSAHARDINGRGQVVRSSGGHAFIWEKSVMTDIHGLGPWSDAEGINNRGQVVGYYDIPTGGIVDDTRTLISQNRRDIMDEPCEVDHGRGISDATVTNPHECKPRDSFPTSFRRGAIAAGTHVSLTTLAAPKEARKAYNKAVKELAKEDRNYGKAAHHLETAVRLYPDFAEAWHLLGETCLATEQNHRAQAAFERALAADPRFPNSYLPLALMELKRGKSEEAARFADEVLKYHPHLSEARFYSAVAHYNQGHISEARESISLIIRNGDDRLYPRVHVMLGEMLAAEGNFRAAAAEYRRVLELEPHSRVSDVIRRQLDDWRERGLLD